MKHIIHIVPGFSAASTLRQALSLGKEDVLVFEDSLDGGPICDFQSLGEWNAMRREYWSAVCEPDGERFPEGLQHAHDSQSDCIAALSRADEIIVWAGADVREQLYLLWVFRLFECYRLDAARLRLIQTHGTEHFLMSGICIYNPGQLKEWYEGEHRVLDAQDSAELKRVWQAVTSATPEALMQCYASGSPRLPRLAESLPHFIKRYPDRKNGLNLHQYCLLFYADRGPPAARVIGYTMGYMDEHGIDFAGDMLLFDLMKKLGDDALPQPALTLTGNIRELRGTEVRLNDMGRQYLAGKANFIELNGLDYWVGAVHLTPENLWYYDNGKLIAA